MSAAPQQLAALTGIRGIAAWAVVFYHIRLSLTDLLPAPLIAILGKGYLAVDLFFVLSGFVIWYNYAERLRGGGEVRRFLWKRFARVWPLHVAVLAAFAVLSALLALTGHNPQGYPLAELPLHFALVQNWGLTDVLSWNHPAWSISTEFAAYLLFPALIAASRLGPLPRWALLALAVLLALAIHLLFALSGYTSLGEAIPTLGMWRCLAGFALGNLMCILWQAAPKARAWPWALVAIGWLGLGVMAGLPETALVPAATFAGLLALAHDTGPVARALGGRVLHYLGEISYSTYLAHFLLFICFKFAIVDVTMQLGWGGLTGFVALVFAASVVLYHGVEKPAQAWLTRHPPRWIAPRAAVPAE